MNIFVLDEDPTIAATYHNDRHVVKMILEYATLMQIAHSVLDDSPLRFLGEEAYETYRPLLRQYRNYPVAEWVRESNTNYAWLWLLASALLIEYRERYNKEHVYTRRIKALCVEPRNIKRGRLTDFALSMPVLYRQRAANAVQAYRLYYIHEKAHIATWRPPAHVPEWWRAGGRSLGSVRTGEHAL